MSVTRRTGAAAALAILLLAAGQLVPAAAAADPDPVDPQVEHPQPEVTEPDATGPESGLLHNVTYRARADGTSRGAIVAYKADDDNINSEQPTMLPGQTFEVNTVLSDPAVAGMELSIDWPYGSNLHCEILVDDEIVVQADQFIAPRLLRPKDDPLYGVLQCGAPLELPATPALVPADPADQDQHAPEPVPAL